MSSRSPINHSAFLFTHFSHAYYMKFLDFVINDLYNNQQFKDNLQDVIVVLPTRRAGAFLKQALGRISGDKPVCSPQVTTISDLIDYLCPYRKADEIEAVCLLYDIYRKSGENRKLSIDAFYGWGRQLIADFNNVDKSCGQKKAEDILAFARDARNFDEPGIDKEIVERIKALMQMLPANDGEEREKGGSESESAEAKEVSIRKDLVAIWRKLPDIYKELTEKLSARGAKLEGAQNQWVLENIEDVKKQLEGHTLVFAGFNFLLKSELLFMEELKDAGMALFYWDYDPNFSGSAHVYEHIAENIKILGGKYENDAPLFGDNWPKKDDNWPKKGDNRPKKEVDLYSAQSDNAQAHFITDWLSSHYEKDEYSHEKDESLHENRPTAHEKKQTTAVVLCNEQMLESAIFSVPPELSGEVNITKGFPMRNAPIFSQISRLLSTEAKRQATPADMISKTLDLINTERDELRENGFPEIPEDTDEFTWHQLLQAESLYQALQVVMSFSNLLDNHLLSAKISLPTLRNLLLRHLGSVSIPFHGEPITDIQIIGVLETRALDFDNLLLLNVEEGIIPHTSIDRSFIPFYIRKIYGMPTSDEDTEIYAYNFFRLLRRAEHISIAYSEAQSAEGQKQMSRFVLQMLTSPQFDCHCYLLSDNNALPNPESEQAIHNKLLSRSQIKTYAEKLANGAEKLANGAAPAALPSPQSPFAAASANNPKSQKLPSLSPSAINTFIACKMKFFIRYMLGINEPDSEDVLLQANELGSLIHGALQAIYEAIKNPQTGDVSPADIKDVIDNKHLRINLDKAINISIAKMNNDYQKFHGKTAPAAQYSAKDHQIEVAVAKTHVEKVLKYDAANGGFRLIDTERNTYLTINVPNLGINVPNLGDLLIGGSIDRLDVVNEARKYVLRVIDYKTGGYDKKKLRTDSIADLFDPQKTQSYVLQTFIYCLACLKDTSAPPQSPAISTLIKRNPWTVSPRLLFTQKDLSKFEPRIRINNSEVTDFENQISCGGSQSSNLDSQSPSGGSQNSSGGNQSPSGVQTLCAEFESALTDFVKKLLTETEFPMTTDVSSKSPCAYCPYKLLCGRTNISGW